ncbi:unnamed protein product [Durusdinium trenchii]|uniref:EF-hand domain-containing protein n=1 Tax=Durusdinium trenchii TaxID=1381693 RepID=A0ABP0SU85_9DINO
MQPVKEVTCLCASEAAFAAVCGRGRVVTWGHPHFGGDSGAVAAQLTSVRHVVATCAAFCALRHDGSLVAWGVSTCGGTLPSPAPTGVASLAASNAAFAAVTERGVVTWGISGGGGDSSRVQPELYDVLHVVASARAFCALRRDGAIITWGDPNYGAAGPSSAAAVDRGHGRWTLAASERAFAALSAEGQLITWGDPDAGRRTLVVIAVECKKSTIDASGQGMIKEERLQEILANPKVKAYFQTLEIDVHEGHALFHLLDNGDGEVTLEEFIDGLMRCKGPARAIDAVALHADLRQLDAKVGKLIGHLKQLGLVRSKSRTSAVDGRRHQAQNLKVFRIDQRTDLEDSTFIRRSS